MSLKKRIDREAAIEAEAAIIAEERMARQKKLVKLGARVVGLSLLTGAVLALATKRIFDEIFLEDDWSDVDWGEDEDGDFVIN